MSADREAVNAGKVDQEAVAVGEAREVDREAVAAGDVLHTE
jgi:hypothetical protein